MRVTPSSSPDKPPIYALPFRQPGDWFGTCWFAAAGMLLALYFLIVVWERTRYPNYINYAFLLVPIITAGISGATYGRSILDTQRTASPFQAFWHGIRVALLAFGSFLPLISMVYASMVLLDGWSIGEFVHVTFAVLIQGLLPNVPW